MARQDIVNGAKNNFNMGYFERLQKIKLGQLPKESGPKPKKPLKRIGNKKAAEMKTSNDAPGGEDQYMKDNWFKRRRLEMVGICQCGYAMPSSKNDDKYFRSSICHIFPQRLFPSIQFHGRNWVERKFWATRDTSACHAQMDNKSMDLWPKMADWDDIKEKFFILEPLLTDEERKKKFYLHLKKLVTDN